MQRQTDAAPRLVGKRRKRPVPGPFRRQIRQQSEAAGAAAACRHLIVALALAKRALAELTRARIIVGAADLLARSQR
jgi:hypothetical protein